ncbi:hypothetical protein WA538_001975 [Blastocystis sp. DL]
MLSIFHNPIRFPIRPLVAMTISTVSKGVAYEEEVGRVLGTLQMQLHRCGGPNDGGIDLQVSEEVDGDRKGIWTIDSPAIPLVVQCKDTSHCTTGMVEEECLYEVVA